MFAMLRMRWLFTLLPRTWRYMNDARVPFYYKFLPFTFIAFFFTPVARIMSLIPVAGLLDEFTILLLSLALFTYLSDKVIKRKDARQESKGGATSVTALEVLEGEYQVIEQHAKAVKSKDAMPSDAHEVKH